MNLNRMALRQMVLGLVGRMIKWSTVDRLSARKGWIYATPPPALPELDEQAIGQLVRLIQHFGFRSQPTPGSEIIVGAPRACGTNAVALGTDNLGCGPSDLEEGATAIYSSADRKNNGAQELCRVRLGADGKVAVDAKAGQDVVVNQGTKKVARVTDTVDIGQWSVTISGGAITAISVIPPGGGAPVVLSATPTALSAKISSGADRFKA